MLLRFPRIDWWPPVAQPGIVRMAACEMNRRLQADAEARRPRLLDLGGLAVLAASRRGIPFESNEGESLARRPAAHPGRQQALRERPPEAAADAALGALGHGNHQDGRSIVRLAELMGTVTGVPRGDRRLFPRGSRARPPSGWLDGHPIGYYETQSPRERRYSVSTTQPHSACKG